VAAQRIGEMSKELDIKIEQAHLILNRVPNGIPVELKESISQVGVPLLGVIPTNDELTTFEYSGRPLVDLDIDSPVYRAVEEMLKILL